MGNLTLESFHAGSMLDGYWLFSEPSSVEKGHQEIAGVLWGSVLFCCALSD